MTEVPPRMNVRKMIGIVALIFFAGLIGLICWRVDDWGRDWTTNSAQDNFAVPNRTIDSAVKQVQHWADGKSNWHVSSEQRTDTEAKMHLTRSTSVWKFTDDVHLTIRLSDAGVTIEATSKSRIGKGDLGQNPRNLAELATAFE